MADNIYSPEYVRRLFDQMSGSYERMNYITSFGFSGRWRSQFLNVLRPLQPGAEIIDLLTGMGETWSAIRQKFPGANLTVLDFSEGMLKYAQQKSRKKFGNQITVIQQDVLQNQLPDDHFDIVTCAFGLKTFNAEQLAVLAAETRRILKPGGQFSFIEISQPKHPILKTLYMIYLKYAIPVLGRLLLGNPEEYRMLWQYTNSFGNARNAARIFEQAGLNTYFASYFFGCATGLYGQKH